MTLSLLQHKQCTKCKVEKSLSEFHKRKNSKTGAVSHCKICRAEEKAQKYWADPQKFKDKAKQNRLQNLDKHKIRSNAWKTNNPEKVRENTLRRRYGIGIDQYNTMLESQENCCAICKANFAGKSKGGVVDHNHNTGKVRGLLCSPCNTALGLLYESRDIILNMLKYIDKHA